MVYREMGRRVEVWMDAGQTLTGTNTHHFIFSMALDT